MDVELYGVLKRGKCSIDSWYEDQTSSVQAEFDASLDYLLVRDRREWSRPQAARLSGNSDIYVIRFKAEKTQFRPLGFFGPSRGQFTIVLFAIEKGDKFVPKDALEQAVKNMKKIQQGTLEIIKYDPEANQ